MEINKWVKMLKYDEYPQQVGFDYNVWIWTNAGLYTEEQYEERDLSRGIEGLYYMIRKRVKPKRPKQLNEFKK